MKTISLNQNLNQIEISFPYAEGLVRRVKEIPNVSWDNENTCWFMPASKMYAQYAQTLANEHQFSMDNGVYQLLRKDMAQQRDHLYPYQRAAVDFAHANNGSCLIADDMGCIDGDAEIIINRGGKGTRYTLASAHDRFHGINTRYAWDRNIPTATRSVNEATGELRLNKILNIIDKGYKDTIYIKTESHEIKLTPDHRVFTPDGWIEARDIYIGSIIYTNGNKVCPICGTTEKIITNPHTKYFGYCRTCMYRYMRQNRWQEDNRNCIDSDGYIRVNSLFQHPHATLSYYVVEHRLVYESYLNGVPYNKWVEMCNKGFDRDNYKFLSPSDVVHHKDGNKLNNNISNLEVLSSASHSGIHADVNRLSEFMIVKAEQVEMVWREPQSTHVYDVSMEAPNSSFVANGIVVHNCGKTVEALTYALESDAQSVLIVCPASVLYKWQDEVTKWTGWESQVVLTGKLPINGARVLIMSYAIMLRRIYELTEREFALTIFDESTHINSVKAKTSLAADQLISKAKLFLSGTPFMNRPIELFHVLHMIDPYSFKSYWSFANKYAGASKQEIWTSNGKRTFWDVSGATNLDELKKRIEPIVIRRTKSEVMKDLPELTRTKIEVDINNKSEYVSALVDFKRYLKENGKTLTSNALTKLNYLRQIVGHGKIESACELAEEALSDPNRKVVLYAHHKDVVAKLVGKLSDYGCATVVGDDSNTKRAEVVKKFQEQTLPRVLVISDAGGEGIDLFSADTIIITELPWHDSSLEQLEGRLHRNGQKNAVTSYVLVGRKTVDDHIYNLIYDKRDVKGELFSMNSVIELLAKGE